MTDSEKLLYLIHFLLGENGRYAAVQIPEDEGERWQLYRSLVNVRPAGELPPEYLEVQNEYLKSVTEKKGITDAENIPPCPKDSRIAVWRGDITTLRADAIVNAANSGMTGCYAPCHNCIDNIIHTMAGFQLRNACHYIMANQGYPEPTGNAKITPGFNLPCKYVLHTVGPIITEGVTPEDVRLLASCYRSCLSLAGENGCKSVAFCCISTGVFRVPKKEAAAIALVTVQDFLNSGADDMKVIFNVFTDEDEAIYRDICR